jgi:hypothetical protein
MQLGSALALATIAKTAFVPPADRENVMDAFTDLKQRVTKASLKTVQKNQVIAAIDGAIKAIKLQPERLVQQNGAGADTQMPGSEQRTGHQTQA